MSAEAARIAGAVASVGLAVLIVARPREARLAGLGAWAIGMVLLAFYLAPSSHQRVLMAAAVVGVVLAVALALLFRRWPWALAFLTLACVPARIPVRVGGTEANLLVPLYAVVAGAALLLAWELVRGAERSRELGPLAWPLAAYVAWTGASLLWSGDPHQGAISVFFFYLPFGLLTVSLSRLPWNPRAVVWLLGELVAMAIVFAVIGVYQWATRDIFWNPKVIVGNAYAPFFRVNSVFYDPSVYGRFLVVAITACLVVALYAATPRIALAAGLAISDRVGGAAVLVLAVELRGARRGGGVARGDAVALARRARPRARCGRHRRRGRVCSADPQLDRPAFAHRPEPCDERTLEAA